MKAIYNPHLSVDCVVFGFDGEQLKVLLLERHINHQQEEINDKKLPGSMIYEKESLDAAAARVLNDISGMKNIFLSQFHTFGDPERTANPRDRMWLELTTNVKVDRIVTVGYMALMRIGRKLTYDSADESANWYEINEIERLCLAFDHKQIIKSGLDHIRHCSSVEPHLLFQLLPRKFTITQFRKLYDVIFNVKSDVRNFQKKIKQMDCLEETDEFEAGVSHRAARLYKFKKKEM